MGIGNTQLGRTWRALGMASLLALAHTLTADTIILRDGTEIEDVRNVRVLDGVVVYVSDGRTQSIAEVKVARVLDRRGRVQFEAQSLTVEEIRRLASPTIYVFSRNGKEVARGEWETEGTFDLDGRRIPEGTYRQYYDSGRVWREFTVAEDELNGPCRVFFKSGRLEREGKFVDGRETGTSILYYPTGILRGQAAYENGQKHGMTRLFYETGELQAEMPFVEGEPHGSAKLYYESGAIETEVVFERGQRHGQIRQYWESGKPRMEGTFVRGRLNGEVRLYYESGRLRKRQVLNHGRILEEVAREPGELAQSDDRADG